MNRRGIDPRARAEQHRASLPPRRRLRIQTRRNEEIYRSTLFSRDDRVFDTLGAGINAGQHEGGGKSLEIRRFGFNMDHGGVGGGLKVLVDDVQQNHATQGHGQGYLGQLKSLTPELVQEVSIVIGPFSIQYGDFSGLGVVHIPLKESLPDLVTVRLQGGSFDTLCGFVAYSPDLERDRAYVAYEASRTDGPFLKVDGFLARPLFDHFINFTFFVDETNGDAIVQHDSRLMEGANAQYLEPVEWRGTRGLLTIGGNYHDNQIFVSLARTMGRAPLVERIHATPGYPVTLLMAERNEPQGRRVRQVPL